MKKQSTIVPNPHLKRARERQGWSQEYVAREVGTDAFTVSRWERGVTMPSPHFRQKLCALFALSTPELGLLPAASQEPSQQAPSQLEAMPLAPAANLPPVIDPSIPPALTREHGLVGRDELLRQLKQRLLGGGHVALSAFNGLPGVGKTALAMALAHDTEVRAHFNDGVLWAGVGYDPDVLALLSRWGRLLDAAPFELAQRSRPDAWAASIHAAIGQRRLLLVIDDAWDVAHALALQVGGPNCTHLVTTRFPEIARRFAAESAMIVRELEGKEGRLLLMRLVPEVVEAEPEEAQALVAAVGGLPLALTLLGNYLRGQAHSGQPRRLRAALERFRSANGRLQLAEPQALVGGHPSLAAGTPLSLQAVIGISDQQVSEQARAALRALAVFPPKPNTFSEEAALAVSALLVTAIDELADAGLLESSGAERYTLHQTIADYARAHLVDERVLERLVTYFVPYIEMHAADYAVLDRENSNILAALEAAYERGMRAELVRGTHALAAFLTARGLHTVEETFERRAEEAARALGDSAGQATALLHLARLMVQRAQYALAQEYCQTGLALARQIRHDGLTGETLLELGVLAWQQAQPQQAHKLLEEALVMSRQAGKRRDEGSALRHLGILARERGQPETARRLYEEALAIFRQLGEQREIALTLNNLGVLGRQQGQPEWARQLLEESLAMSRHLGDRRAAATTLGNLSRIAENQGHPELAIQQYEEALSAFRQLGDRRSAAQVMHNLGTLAWLQGQPESARQLYEESLAMLRQLGDRRTAALTLHELGSLERQQGQVGRARELLEEALDTFRQLEDWREVALAVRELGALARQQEQLEQARKLLVEALDTLRQLGDRREAALTVRELGALAVQQAQPDYAQQLLEEALDTFRHLEDRREVARTLNELGALARQQAQPDHAQQFLEEALAILRQVGDRRNVAHTFKELGMLAQQQGRLKEALPLLLSAAVGLLLVDAPDAQMLEKMLSQVHAQMGENVFTSAVKRIAKEAPEPTYKLDQAAWVLAVRKLAAQPVAT